MHGLKLSLETNQAFEADTKTPKITSRVQRFMNRHGIVRVKLLLRPDALETYVFRHCYCYEHVEFKITFNASPLADLLNMQYE